MKNLKRALSLVLSTAMLVGMMVVGTGAASFTDVAESDHKEAIEVMNMVGIMEGTGEGTFEPDRVVTRNEMAVVMCNLLDLKLNGAHPFNDVAAWADDYVAAIYTNGYTAGKSATTFGGNDKITTAEAALMIMKTLGYFEYQGEFGDDWKLATVKKATELQLFDNIGAGINDGLTRGEVAQMVLNALDEEMVIAEEIGGLTVEGNGITVTEKARYNHWPYQNDELDCVETLMTKLYNGDLEKTEKYVNGNTEDAFGRPAVKWTYNDGIENPSVTIAKEPAVVFTAEEDLKAVTKALKDYDIDDEAIVPVVDGVDNTAAAIDTLAEYVDLTGNGVAVEVYANKTLDVTDIVVVKQHVGKITVVTAADEEADTKRTVTVNSMEYETEDFARKDVVIYTVAAGEIKSMKLAETVEGKITAVASSYIKIDGVTYKANDSYSFSTYGLGDTVSLYVDSYGYVIALDDVIETAASIEDYVVVTKVDTTAEFGSIKAKVLYADGTTATMTVDTEGDAISASSVGELYTVKKTDDGYKFTAAETVAANAGYDAVYQSGSNSKDKGTLSNANVADDAVVFVYADSKYSVITGAELKKLANGVATTNIAYANKAANGFATIELAYVDSTSTVALDDVAYGYVVDDVEAVKNADDDTVASIKFWNGTETVTVIATTDYDVENNDFLEKGDFFQYNLNADGELDEIVEITSGEDAVLAYDNDKNIMFNDGAYVEMTDDTVVMYVDTKNVKGVAEGDIELADEIIAADGTETGTYTGNVIVNVNSDSEVVYLIVDVNNNMIMNAQPQV